MSHTCTVEPYVIKYTPKEPKNVHPDSNFYGFDLDHTIIRPKNPKAIFAKASDDWKPMVYGDEKESLTELIKIVTEDPTAQIVIFTNQGGVITLPRNSKSCQKFTGKIDLILRHIETLPHGDVLLPRLWLYSSTMKPAALFPRSSHRHKKVVKPTKTQSTLPLLARSKNAEGKSELDLEEVKKKFDLMRKPKTGMVDELLKDLQKSDPSFELDGIKWKYYCGDAAGRKSDFSDSDKVFAEAMGIVFKVPEDVFI